MENLASKKVENMGKVLSWGAGRLRELKTYHISSTDAQPLLSLSIDLKTVRNSSPCLSREAFLLSVKVAIFLFYMGFFIPSDNWATISFDVHLYAIWQL